jgi:hypothetical protein
MAWPDPQPDVSKIAKDTETLISFSDHNVINEDAYLKAIQRFPVRLALGGRATASIRYRNEWRWNGPPKWARNAFFEGKKAVIARGPSDPNGNEDE